MTGEQSGKSEPKKANPGKIALIGGGATVLAIFNIASNTEAPSQAVMILEYAGLIGGLVALAGGLIMMATARN